MKNQVLFIVSISTLLLASCSNNKSSGEQSSPSKEVDKAKDMSSSAIKDAPPVAAKKYGIKSGIIQFETMMEMSGTKIPGKKIIYFDDWGMKECEETFEDGKLKESFVSDGKERFKLFHSNKSIYKAGAAYNGTAMAFNWNEVSQKDKDAGLANQGGKETVAGKECETYTYITQTAGQKTTAKYAGWNHILLLMELNSKEIKSTSKATKFEENVAVPSDKFTAPGDYKVL